MRRYKRFLADALLDGADAPITAHIADPGRLTGLAVEGARLWLSRSRDPRRKLAHSVEAIAQNGVWVGVDPASANRLVENALAEGGLDGLLGPIASHEREVAIAPGTRLDFRLRRPDGGALHLEVKSVSWREGDALRFPDAPSARARRHLDHLRRLLDAGEEAMLLFVVQRQDGAFLEAAADIDPDYAAALAGAAAAGLKIAALRAAITSEGRWLDSESSLVPLKIPIS